MTPSRHLDWDGCFNARDLGGLRTTDGRSTRHGAIVRADALDHLTAAGWAALEAHGVRTIVDLRNDDELTDDLEPRPAGLTTIHLPLDGVEDTEFWADWLGRPEFGTPLYYGPHLERFPRNSARVVAAIAGAEPGGVLFHCGIGRDRTGQIAMLVLTLARVEPEEIAADYALSAGRLAPLMARRGEPDHLPAIEGYFEREKTTPRAVMAATLASIDAAAVLRAGGLRDEDVATLRGRLVG